MQETYDGALEAAVGQYAPLRDGKQLQTMLLLLLSSTGSLETHFRRAAKMQSDAYDVLLSEFAQKCVPQMPGESILV